LDFRTAVIALVVLVVSGVLASLMPAARAAAVNPIVALQEEKPLPVLGSRVARKNKARRNNEESHQVLCIGHHCAGFHRYPRFPV
jgi:hypothetical protein